MNNSGISATKRKKLQLLAAGVSLLAKNVELPPLKGRVAAEKYVRLVFAAVKLYLAEGQDIYIPGVGTLTPKRLAERRGRNPRTGEEMVAPSRVTIRFKQSQRFRQKINRVPDSPYAN